MHGSRGAFGAPRFCGGSTLSAHCNIGKFLEKLKRQVIGPMISFKLKYKGLYLSRQLSIVPQELNHKPPPA
jgi:hypothetical protein